MSGKDELEKLRQRKRLADLNARSKKIEPEETIPEPPSLLERTGRGVMDVIQGGRQLLPEGYGGHTPEQAAEIADNENIYNKGYNYWNSSKNDKGVVTPDLDGYRIGGQAIGTAPLMAIPGGQSTALARIAAGVGVGGAAGGILYEQNPNDKIMNAALGAGAGGLFSAAAPLVTQAAGKGYAVGREVMKRGADTIKSLNPKITGTITTKLDDAFANLGVPLNEVGDAAREKLVNEANASIKNTGAFDADALVRKYRAESMGFVDDAAPTTGQVTRDPRVWGKEINIAKGEDDAGGILAGRFQNQKNQITETFKGWQRELFGEGADELTPYSVLSNVKKTVQDKSKALQDKVNEAYNKVPGGVSLNKESLSNRTQQVLQDFKDSIPSGVKARLDSVINNPNKAFVYDDYVQLDQLINKTMGDTPSSQSAAKELKKAISGVLDESGSKLQGEAKAAYEYAKSLAKKRFDQLGADNELVGMLNSGKLKDQQFLNKITTNSTVDEVRQLFNFADDSAKQQVRTLVLNDIIEQSTKSGDFKQHAFNSYLKKIPKEKLDIVFGETANTLNTFGKVMQDFYSAPSGHTANFSNSGIEVGNMVRRLYGGLIESISPEARLLSSFVSKVPNKAAQNQSVVDLALSSGLPKSAPLLSAQNPITPEMLSNITRGSTVSGILGTQQ